jgi:cellulase/cellobiase CelA1
MRPIKKKEEMDDIPEFAPYAKKKYGDKKEYNKAGELLNKGVRTIQDGVGKGYDKGKELISDFIKDTKKDGVGETLRDRGNNIKHIIDEYVKNNEFLQKANRGAKKANKALGIDKYLNKEKDYE